MINAKIDIYRNTYLLMKLALKGADMLTQIYYSFIVINQL